MGGLVSRPALKQLHESKENANVSRLIMLGTLNYGTYLPVQALSDKLLDTQRLFFLYFTFFRPVRMDHLGTILPPSDIAGSSKDCLCKPAVMTTWETRKRPGLPHTEPPGCHLG